MPDDFQAEQDMHALAEADKIMDSPGRIQAARDAAKRKQESLTNFLTSRCMYYHIIQTPLGSRPQTFHCASVPLRLHARACRGIVELLGLRLGLLRRKKTVRRVKKAKKKIHQGVMRGAERISRVVKQAEKRTRKKPR